MKKIVIITVFLFVLPMTAQKEKAILHFKDDSKITGLAKIISSGARIKFRKDKQSKYKVYTPDNVESIEIYEKESFSTTVYSHYYFRKTKKNTLPRLLKLMEDGKANLYLDYNEYNKVFVIGSNGISPAVNSSISHYYVSRAGDEFVTRLGGQGSLFKKNFKKGASEYFKDCPELVKKIENKEFKRRDIEEVVNFYNRECE